VLETRGSVVRKAANIWTRIAKVEGVAPEFRRVEAQLSAGIGGDNVLVHRVHCLEDAAVLCSEIAHFDRIADAVRLEEVDGCLWGQGRHTRHGEAVHIAHSAVTGSVVVVRGPVHKVSNVIALAEYLVSLIKVLQVKQS